MFGTILKKTFWNTFDHLGSLVLINLVWVLLSIPWLVGGYAVLRALADPFGVIGVMSGFAAWLVAVWLSPGSLWAFGVAAKWADYQSTDRTELMRLLRGRFLLGVWLSIVAFIVSLALGMNAAFYLRLTGMFYWVGLVLAGVMMWALVALLSICYHLGLLLAREHTVTLREALRRATVIALSAPFPSVFYGMCVLVYAALISMTQIGFPLIALTFPAMFAATAERELLKRFHPPEEHDRHTDGMEEVRTLRDLLKPWDMDR
jgi:hypothetical protein